MSRSSNKRCSIKKLFLNWMKWGKIQLFYIYSLHFGIIIIVGKWGHISPFSRSIPTFLRFPPFQKSKMSQKSLEK